MWWRPEIGMKRFFKRLYQAFDDHGVADSAATLSYYFLFSLFPFLFFLATLTAYIPYIQSSLEPLLARARLFLPGQAMSIIDTHLRGLLASPRPGLLTLGLFVALYTASLGVDSVRKALNRAYDVKESRPFWKTQLLAFGMTAGGGLLVLIGITLLIAGGSAGFWAARHLGIGDEYILILRWIRWPITTALIILCVALTYYVLPDVKQEFRFITPGSIIGVLIWFLASWAFSTYVSHFGSYNVTYGSIGGVIVLMTWFYITGIILILGGEINAIIEDAASTGKASGARTASEAPPPPGERPSAMPVGAASSASVADRASAGSPKQGREPSTEMSRK